MILHGFTGGSLGIAVVNSPRKSDGAILAVIVNYSQGKPTRREADYEAALDGNWTERIFQVPASSSV